MVSLSRPWSTMEAMGFPPWRRNGTTARPDEFGRVADTRESWRFKTAAVPGDPKHFSRHSRASLSSAPTPTLMREAPIGWCSICWKSNTELEFESDLETILRQLGCFASLARFTGEPAASRAFGGGKVDRGGDGCVSTPLCVRFRGRAGENASGAFGVPAGETVTCSEFLSSVANSRARRGSDANGSGVRALLSWTYEQLVLPYALLSKSSPLMFVVTFPCSSPDRDSVSREVNGLSAHLQSMSSSAAAIDVAPRTPAAAKSAEWKYSSQSSRERDSCETLPGFPPRTGLGSHGSAGSSPRRFRSSTPRARCFGDASFFPNPNAPLKR
mmetsp:Transcript_12755/g.42335  ORF Transcript_12755/g.42335 Transcript_12755/m.42335 type:complete len:328 (+) Transcript_12755:435-1418(+)